MPPITTETHATAPPVEIPTPTLAETTPPSPAEAVTAMPEGGITEHKNRYGDNPLDCPFLNSMGAAGIKLAEQLEVAQDDPNRGKTIGEILAEKAQQKSQQEKQNHVLPEIEVAITEPMSAAKEIAQKLEEIYIREIQKEIIPVQEGAIDNKMPPVKKVKSFELPLSIAQIKLPTKETSFTAEEAVIPQTPLEKKSHTIPNQPEQPEPIHIPETTMSINPPAPKVTPELSVKETPMVILEAPEVALTPEDISLALPLPAEQDIEAVINKVTSTTEQILEQPAKETETSAVDIITIEEILQDWLVEDEPETTEATPSVDMLDRALPVAEPETKMQVVSVLENVVQVLHEVSNGRASLEVATKQIQELATELFELLGLEPSEEVVARVVQDILMSSHTVNKDTIELSDAVGTHELKKSLAQTVQAHVAYALHARLARLKELSRYIIEKLTRPVLVTNPVAQV